MVVCGSGTFASETREVHDFNVLAFMGIGLLKITQGEAESLTIEAEDNILPLLTATVVNGELRLGARSGRPFIPTREITYQLQVKQLSAVRLSGAGIIHADHINGQSLMVSITGAGSVTIRGEVEDTSVTLSGVGIYNGEELLAKSASVRCSGAGTLKVAARDRLDVTVSGVGTVQCYGNPRITKSVSGIGKFSLVAQ
jgi:hypothetical protein